MLVGALAVQVRHGLHFSTARLGLAVATYNAAAALSSVPMGHLVERVGGVRVMRFTSILGVAVLLSLATLTRSWVDLVAILIGAGIISAAVQPATNLFLSRHIPKQRQGFAFGIKQSSVPLAGLIAGLAVPVVALTIGWRWAFAGASSVALLAASLVPTATRTSHRSSVGPSDQAGPPETAKPTSEATTAELATTAEVAAGAEPPKEHLFPLVVLAAAFGLGIAASNCLSVFLVTSAVDSGTGKGMAGIVAASASMVGLTARITTGIQADRRGEKHLPVVATMLALGAAGYVGLGVAGSSLWFLVAAAALAYGAGWGWNGLFSFAVVRVHPQFPARATGITQAGGRLGGIVGPLVFGIVVDNASYAAAWDITALTALAASALMVAGRKLLLFSRQAGISMS